MKKSVAITAVLALHIAVISMLLVQAGCSSEPEAPEVAKAKTTTEEVTTIAPAEQKAVDASVSEANLPPEGSAALRVAPTRPVYNMDKQNGGSGEVLVKDEPLSAEPAQPKQAKADSEKVQPKTDAAVEPANMYTVKKGDNLSTIAKKHHVSVSELLAANGLNRTSVIKIGQEIKIPASGMVESVPAPKAAEAVNAQVSAETETYVVKSGDSLSRIGKKHSISVKQLMAINNLKNHNIKVGQKLLVTKSDAPATKAEGAKADAPKAEQAPRAAKPAATLAAGEISYEIKSGDTLGVIAKKNGTSVSAICARNGISDPRKIRVGQKIVIVSKAAKAEAPKADASKAEKIPAQTKPAEPAISVTADVPAPVVAPSAPATTTAPTTNPAPVAPATNAAPAANTVPVIEI